MKSSLVTKKKKKNSKEDRDISWLPTVPWKMFNVSKTWCGPSLLLHTQENQRRENALGHAHQTIYTYVYTLFGYICCFVWYLEFTSSASRRCAEPHLPPLYVYVESWAIWAGAVIYKRRRQTRGLVVILRKFPTGISNQHITSRTFIRFLRIFFLSNNQFFWQKGESTHFDLGHTKHSTGM